MLSNYQHLFFDLDHTLWDFEGNAHDCLIDMYDHFNLKSMGVEDARLFFEKFSEANQYYWAMLEKKAINVEQLRKERFKHAFANLGIEIDTSLSLQMTDVFLELLPQKERLIEGAIDVLDYLKPHYQLHILTNGWHGIQVKKMKSSRIDHYFDAIITIEGANARKPDKAIFDHALEYTKASLSNSLMIGDNYEADIKGAKNANWDTVFYNPDRQEFTEKPTFEIVKLVDIKTFL